MTLGKRAGIASALVRGGRRAVKCAKIIFLDDAECFFHSAQAGFWAIVEITNPQTCLPTDQRSMSLVKRLGPFFGDVLRRPFMGTARTVDINPDPETVTLQQQELRVPAEGTSPQSSTDVN